MTRASYGAPLEQACLRAGLWLIEGHTVERYRYGWIVWDPAHRHQVARVRTLGEARDWLRERVG